MSTAAATTKIASPYPGLRPLEPHEADIFFGRGVQIDRMLSRLEEHRFLDVVGASGCGKSSLVRAGLLPARQQGFLEGGATHWRFVIMRPAGAPLTQLAQSFHNALEESPPLPEDVAFTEATLRRSPRGLVDTIAESAHQVDTQYLLLVDQFEEIFRFRYRNESDQSTDAGRTVYDERNEATAFVNLLLATAKQAEFPIYVVITMWSDFTGDCDAFRDLPEAINESQFLAPRLTREQLLEVIIGPLQVFQSEAEPELVSAILNDVGNDPDQLPLMQHALMRTCLQAQKRTAGAGQERLVLKLEDYLTIGGLKEALSRHADQTYAELHTREKQRVAEIMLLNPIAESWKRFNRWLSLSNPYLGESNLSRSKLRRPHKQAWQVVEFHHVFHPHRITLFWRTVSQQLGPLTRRSVTYEFHTWLTLARLSTMHL
jgi:energy-coupling factor transporter ATP-binding protein EcfA2